jgi:hypothetical protein
MMAVQSFRNSLTLTVWCIMRSYRLDNVSQVMCICKFFRGCVMQFGGNGAKSGTTVVSAIPRREKHSYHYLTTKVSEFRSK